MQNKRYRRTEEAIFIAYFNAKEMLSVKDLARRAGISRITLYRHHPLVQNIVQDYERYIVGEYGRTMRRAAGQQLELKAIFRWTLIFVLQKKQVILVLLQNGHTGVIEGIIEKISAKIAAGLRVDGAALEVYRGELLGVFRGWSKRNFDETEMGAILRDVVFLTETAQKRLRRFDHD